MTGLTRAALAGALASSLTLPGLASPQFAEVEQLSNTVPGSSGIEAVDLDGDGHLDLLVGSSKGERVSWFAGDGAGGFGQQNVLRVSPAGDGVPDGAIRVLGVDLDLDGDMDVIAANHAEGILRSFENLGRSAGETQFAAPVVLSTFVGGAFELSSADLNGDGYPDLLSASEDDNRIAWLRNLGDGTFANMTVLVGANEDARGVDSGDLDGDGLVDVVAASFGDGRLVWFRNLGGNAFASEVLIADHGSGTQDVAVGDFDGDGDLDLVSSGDQTRLYTNDGAATFTESVLGTASGGRIALADVDLDGDLDVAVSGTLAPAGVELFLGGASGFAAPVLLPGLDAPAVDLAFGDFDADGWPELVSVTGQLPAYFANQAGSLGLAAPKWASNVSPRSSAAGDLNGDGIQDLVVASEVDGHITWFEGLGAGAFGAAQLIGVESTVREVIVRDFDGDGHQDVASRGFSGGGRIAVYYGVGGGDFGAPYQLPDVGQLVQDMAAGDLNNDGLVDMVVVGGFFVQDTYWLEKLPGVGFAAPELLNDTQPTTALVEVLDLDQDGLLDVVIADNTMLGWMRNLGGSFAPAALVDATLAGVRDAVAGDFDGDDVLDLVVTSGAVWFGGQVSLLRGTGGGLFQAPLDLGVSGMTSLDPDLDLGAGDFDGDGLFDFVVTGSLEPARVFLSLGAGSFGPSEAIAKATGVTISDLDGDGDLDLALTDFHEDLILTSRNEAPFADCNGNGVSDLAELAAGTETDFDGNGIPDSCVVPALYADVFALDAVAGGTQLFGLTAGAAHAGEAYFLLGSLSGTTPGIPLGVGVLPLNLDAYLNLSLVSPASTPLTQSIGVLDGTGAASASLVLPPGFATGLVGLEAHHAFVTLAATGVSFVSNAVPVVLF
ncbi:MAG: VCBS repeat-containing protein [Planctomycetota bacterium]|nr:VCBS repeat-containing protein [Planctomycetota bacterium]